MIGRISILLTFLALAITLLPLHYPFWAAISFLLCLASLLEMLMFSLIPYSHGSIRLGKAREAKKIEDKRLCIPVILSFPYYAMNKLEAKIRIGDIIIQSFSCDDNGEPSYDDKFSLEFHDRRTLVAIGYSDSGFFFWGTPFCPKYAGNGQIYYVTLEIWHSGRLITSAKYSVTPTLDIQDISRRS